MEKQKVIVKNSAGLHARPASLLVKLAGQFESDFHINMYGYKINGKSILGVLTLAAEQGAEMELELEGPDEKDAVKALVKLFDSGFNENNEEHG
ncbi:MAG: HPr family phosphocarrier protein [Balneolales bacterium]